MVEEEEGVGAKGIADKVAVHVVEGDRSCFTCWLHAQADSSVRKSSMGRRRRELLVEDFGPTPVCCGAVVTTATASQIQIRHSSKAI